MIRWLLIKWRNRRDKGLDAYADRFAHKYTFKGSDEQKAKDAAKARDQRERQRQRIAAGRRPRKADQQPTKLRGVK